MNQKQLQYFLDCCETKNMQKTADRLFVSRQGVSKMIRDLETELGTPLFHRSQKGLEPKKFAFSLIPHARNLLDE
ncbi:LysR family transcriptional regulator, partial [Acidaminococcus timonensis]|uniref:LysR family transcriptional regulator n=1 Tax=Acidaminococcus timonensis TaxID=1871002 RepID=UPI00307FDEBA